MPRSPRLFIYRSSPSASAVVLAAALRDVGIPARKIGHPPRRLVEGDRFVGWGDYFQLARPVPSLNWQRPVGKLSEMQTLSTAGVVTPRFATALPTDSNVTWLGRSYIHHGGSDLLVPPSHPGFWVEKLDVRQEYRVHFWGGVSARVGMKVPRIDLSGPFEGTTPHSWIRSWKSGWILDYGEGARNVRQRHRDAAKAACSALSLHFGAVDVGELADGRVVVFEVNRAPGLDSNGDTRQMYARKIKEWYEGVDNLTVQ